jgi:hypothetical protein
VELAYVCAPGLGVEWLRMQMSEPVIVNVNCGAASHDARRELPRSRGQIALESGNLGEESIWWWGLSCRLFTYEILLRGTTFHLPRQASAHQRSQQITISVAKGPAVPGRIHRRYINSCRFQTCTPSFARTSCDWR